MLDIQKILVSARSGTLLTARECFFLCAQLREILIKEPNVVALKAPITIAGDIHGQFYDLLELFAVGGECPDTNYLFLGDFVDRGHYSVHTIVLLACLKVRFPSRITLIRGNHESRSVTKVYGFYAECMSRYGSDGSIVWKAFTDMFDYLPVAAVIDDRILGIHGGLSPHFHTVDQLRVVPRFQEVPFEGLLTDIMWSDPESDLEGFAVSNRGVGFLFGGDVVKHFLNINGLDYILRAHQLCQEGYQVLFDETLATVWSAPNYCYRAGNMASILEIDENHCKMFNLFSACPLKYRNPDVTTLSSTNEYFE